MKKISTHLIATILLSSCSNILVQEGNNHFSFKARSPSSDGPAPSCQAVMSEVTNTLHKNKSLLDSPQNIKESLSPTPFDQITGVHKGYIFYNKNKAIFGEISFEDLVEDYKVIKIKDSEGNISVLDPEITPVEVYLSPEKIHASDKLYSKAPTIPALNKEKFLAGICASKDQIANDKNYKKYEQLFKKYIIQQSPIKSRAKAAGMCFGGLGTIPLTGFIAYSTIYNERRYKDYNEQSWYEKHGSNWVLGIGYMAAFHQCSNILAPKSYQTFLALTVGVDVAANIMYEIKLSDDFVPPLEDHAVRTDINDFSSGLMGALSYYMMAQVFKDIFSTSLDSYCKKK